MADKNTYQVILQTTKKGRGAKDTEKDLTGLQKTAKSAGSALTSIGVAAGAVAAALVAAKKAFDFAEEGAQIQRLQDAGDRLASQFGQDMDSIVQSIQNASGGTVDALSAMTTANRAMILGVATTPEEFAKLTTASIALGRAMGEGPQQAIDDIVSGIGRMSPLILDNLGIMTRGGKVFDDYAASLGTTADKLTDAQKKTALLNVTMESAKPLLDANGNLIADNATAFERFGAESSDAGARFKKQFADLIAPFVSDMADSLEAINTVSDAIEQLGATSVNYAGRQFYILADGTRVSRQELLNMATTAQEAGKNLAGVEFHGIATSAQEIADSSANANDQLATMVQNIGQVSDAELAKNAMDGLNTALQDGKIDQSEYNARALDVLTTIGGLSTKQANQRIQLASLNTAYKSGKIDVDNYRKALKKLYDLINGGPPVPGLSAEQQASQQQATMKNFTVPPGFPGDSYGLGLSSNEQVSVSRPGQTSYVTNNNQPTQVFNITDNVDAMAVASSLAKYARRA